MGNTLNILEEAEVGSLLITNGGESAPVVLVKDGNRRWSFYESGFLGSSWASRGIHSWLKSEENRGMNWCLL